MTPQAAPLSDAELAVVRRALARSEGKGWDGLAAREAGAALLFFADSPSPTPAEVPTAHARSALTAIEHCRTVLRDDPAIGQLLGDEADTSPAAHKLRALVRAAGLPPGTPRVFSGLDRSVTISGINFLVGAYPYAESGMTIPEGEAEASLDYFHEVPDDVPLERISAEHARNGAMALERCCVVLDNDFELGTLVGYEPELTGALLKLDAAARPGRG